MPAKRATRRRLLAGGILALAFACAGGSAFAARPARPGTAKLNCGSTPAIEPANHTSSSSETTSGIHFGPGSRCPA